LSSALHATVIEISTAMPAAAKKRFTGDSFTSSTVARAVA
jgi:hypothetical protein